ncbi:MAG: hypothetical protein Q9192_007992, partial [Flavoplaca navasiana]
MLLVCETSIAFISSCVPSIFNLAKHAAAKGYLSLPSRSRRSDEVEAKLNGGMSPTAVARQKRWDFRFKRLGGPLASVNISRNKALLDVNRVMSKVGHDSSMVCKEGGMQVLKSAAEKTALP